MVLSDFVSSSCSRSEFNELNHIEFDMNHSSSSPFSRMRDDDHALIADSLENDDVNRGVNHESNNNASNFNSPESQPTTTVDEGVGLAAQVLANFQQWHRPSVVPAHHASNSIFTTYLTPGALNLGITHPVEALSFDDGSEHSKSDAGDDADDDGEEFGGETPKRYYDLDSSVSPTFGASAHEFQSADPFRPALTGDCNPSLPKIESKKNKLSATAEAQRTSTGKNKIKKKKKKIPDYDDGSDDDYDQFLEEIGDEGQDQSAPPPRRRRNFIRVTDYTTRDINRPTRPRLPCKWDLEILKMSTKHLNAYLRMHTLSQEDVEDLKMCRRRMKNRYYAVSSRDRKSKQAFEMANPDFQVPLAPMRLTPITKNQTKPSKSKNPSKLRKEATLSVVVESPIESPILHDHDDVADTCTSHCSCHIHTASDPSVLLHAHDFDSMGDMVHEFED